MVAITLDQRIVISRPKRGWELPGVTLKQEKAPRGALVEKWLNNAKSQ